MAAQPVEWVLVIYYGPSAHRATYGRLGNTKYTKDYIQLSRKTSFLDAVTRLFPVKVSEEGFVPLTYKWPKGTTPGTLVFNSADRPHLKWETSLGAPAAWKMSLSASDATAETIPGDPTHTEFDAAENELTMLANRGAGQPYLIAIKLHNEPTTLHLRAYLEGPSDAYSWADMGLLPNPIQELARKTSQNSALAWQTFASGGLVSTVEVERVLSQVESSDTPLNELDGLDADLGRGLAAYLGRPGYGLFFDPLQNHNSWVSPKPLSEKLASSANALLEELGAQYPAKEEGDAAAESAEPDPSEVTAFREQIEEGDYSVPDSIVTSKTRGSAQKAFARRVKSNYDYKCAITGIETQDFLIASHIVPWSEDQSIRLDPCNGICLSVLMDRAFEKGHLVIEDDFTIRIDWAKIGGDVMLRRQLESYDGKKLSLPKSGMPQLRYLQRRRALFGSAV